MLIFGMNLSCYMMTGVFMFDRMMFMIFASMT